MLCGKGSEHTMDNAVPDNGFQRTCEMQRVGRDLTDVHHIPTNLSQSNPILSSNSLAFFPALLLEGAFPDPLCFNRLELPFHFQSEAIAEPSSPFALAVQLLTPALLSPGLILLLLLSNVCCTDGGNYHPHSSPT